MYREAGAPPPYVITAFNHQVVAIDAQTGNEVWRVALVGSPIRLHVDETRVVALGTKLVVIEYGTGKVTRTIDHGGTTLLVVGPLAYVSTNGELRCVQLDEGKVLWRHYVPDSGFGAAAIGVPGHVAQADVA